MTHRLRHTLLLVALTLVGAGCSVVRKLPEGSYLVQKVTVETDREAPKEERITASEFDRYIRQTPNKHFLGTNFYVWVYNQADPQKENWWNRFKRKIGEEPVILSEEQTVQSAQNLKYYMDSRGFFSSRALFHIDTTSRRKRAKITYKTIQGEPYRYRRITYEFQDKFLENLILRDTARSLLRPGEIYNIATLDRERERIADYLQQRGYYNFSVNNIYFPVDTTVGNHLCDVRVVIKQHLAGYDDRGQAILENNTVYRIGQINLLPAYDPTLSPEVLRAEASDTTRYRGLNIIQSGRQSVRPKVLRQAVPLYPNYVYDAELVNRTYRNIMGLGYFKSARISFDVLPRDSANVVSYIDDSGHADSTRTQYTQEGYLRCNILCTPQLKQSYKIELEGSTTSSFYGLKATVGYQNRNLFRGLESFDLSFTTGLEFMRARTAAKRRANEFGVTTGLVIPRFLFPISLGRVQNRLVSPRTRIALSFNYQDRPYYRRTLTSMTWTYSWSNTRYSSFSLRPIDLNLIDVGYLDENFMAQMTNIYLRDSYRSQFIAGISGSYSYNNQLKNLGRNATLLQVNWETAGNLLDGLEHLFSRPAPGKNYYEVFGIQYSQYFRVDASISRKIALGEKGAVVGRLYIGYAMPYGNSTSLPVDRYFYCGGNSSMRGWVPRTLGPGEIYLDEQTRAYPQQLGSMRLEANLEFRFPIWGIFHGATFFDAGNVWMTDAKQYPAEAIFHFDDFYRQLGFNTGIGLRLDIKFAVLRLDWGIQLHNPNNAPGDRWIRGLAWKDTALNFGVGYPF